MLSDEGFTDEDSVYGSTTSELLSKMTSEQQCEELAYKLLASLPRSRLATIQRRLAPLLQFDVVGSLPAEVSLHIFSHLPAQTLLTCALNLCTAQGWAWKQPTRVHPFDSSRTRGETWDNSDDEGREIGSLEAAKAELTLMQAELESGFAAMSFSSPRISLLPRASPGAVASTSTTVTRSKSRTRHNSAPPVLSDSSFLRPDYKRLYQTHTRLQNRVRAGSFRLSAIQTRGGPPNAHTTTIYCLQLYTYPSTGVQVLFTGGRDRTVREWNLTTGLVERVIAGVHMSSVLSICVHDGFVASAGSDRRVAVWDLEKNELVKVIVDHEDSVLCVRLDSHRLVSCSKDRTVRTYTFPDLLPQFILGAHRAAVNAVSISDSFIVSGSGDRSIRLWDANTGKLLRTFENHHTRGIASIDFMPPYVVSGSSDKHLRLFDITTLLGWSTSPEYDANQSASAVLPERVSRRAGPGCRGEHRPAAPALCDIETSCAAVALGEEFVLSGSYDLSIKVWDRQTGAMVADLTGGHSGRIFCIGFDCTKIVSCGEDQRICLWDFSHGIDTSFIQL
ncbi:WD40 repeat-like protein [Mycena rebaudengoi]|nr:WD40 repeat-like protein [Mycena rebaudengoi]